jgi:FkbM family methyltransferase
MLLPKSDKHFKTRKVEGYQRKVYDKAIALCEEKRVAIDIGAHVGIFTVRMEEDFDEVFAFEPDKANFDCLTKNTQKAHLFNNAVLHCETRYKMNNPSPQNSGAWEVEPGGDKHSTYLDAFDFDHVDLIKMDIQGCEREAITGAVKTLREHKPILIIEDQEGKTLDGLNNLGYEEVGRVTKDRIFKWAK